MKKLLESKGYQGDVADSYLPVYLDSLKQERAKIVAQRKEYGGMRVYDEAATMRDMATILTGMIKDTEVRIEEARQNVEQRNLEKAVSLIHKKLESDIAGSTASKEWEVERRKRHLEDKLAKETILLEEQLERVPLPKPRYSTRLLNMRHAEKILNQSMRYEEAYDVRRLTKVLEAEEYEKLMEKHQRKLDMRREKLERRHSFERERQWSTLKASRILSLPQPYRRQSIPQTHDALTLAVP